MTSRSSSKCAHERFRRKFFKANELKTQCSVRAARATRAASARSGRPQGGRRSPPQGGGNRVVAQTAILAKAGIDAAEALSAAALKLIQAEVAAAAAKERREDKSEDTMRRC